MAWETIEHYDSARRKVGEEERVVAIRSDGSRAAMVVRAVWFGEDALKIRHVMDLRLREEFTVYPEIKSISTVPVSVEAVEIYSRKPDSSCSIGGPWRTGREVDSSPDPPAILGQRVIKVSWERLDSGRKTVTVEWLAPELDCFSLKRISARYDLEGKLLAENVHTVTSIRLGEPDQELFDKPAGMTERTPSEIRAAAGYLKGVPVAPGEEPGLALQDAAYQRRRGTSK
jgi:hypothetical protein